MRRQTTIDNQRVTYIYVDKSKNEYVFLPCLTRIIL